MHERLRIATGNRTYRNIGEMTGTHHETVRRYLTGQPPAVEWLSRFCAVMGVSTEWVVTGKGPMKRSDARAHALSEANVSELLAAMSKMLERLMERVDRLESYSQTLELRLRSMQGLVEPKNLRATPLAGSADADRVSGVVDAVNSLSRGDGQ